MYCRALEAHGIPVKEEVACCVRAIAATIQGVGEKVDVSAVCKVNKDSGLPEYPIKGKIVFTQSASYSLTEKCKKPPC